MQDAFYKKRTLSSKGVKVTLSTPQSFTVDDQILNHIEILLLLSSLRIGDPK